MRHNGNGNPLHSSAIFETKSSWNVPKCIKLFKNPEPLPINSSTFDSWQLDQVLSEYQLPNARQNSRSFYETLIGKVLPTSTALFRISIIQRENERGGRKRTTWEFKFTATRGTRASTDNACININSVNRIDWQTGQAQLEENWISPDVDSLRIVPERRNGEIKRLRFISRPGGNPLEIKRHSRRGPVQP